MNYLYVLFLFLFFVATAISITGQYIYLKFPHLNLLQSYSLAMPFAWIDWIFMTKAIEVSDKNKLFTPTQDTFLLVTTQFVFVLIYNALVFKNKVTRSDIFAFLLILGAFYLSYNHVISKALGLPYTEKKAIGADGKETTMLHHHRK